MNTNWRLGLTFALVTALMWGLLPLALKGVLGHMDPVTITWYRFSVSAVIALAWLGPRSLGQLHKLFSRGALPWSCLVVFGLLGNYLLYIMGLDYTNPGASQILVQLAPLMLLLVSVLVLREDFHYLQWVGVAGFTVGLVLFFHQRLSSTVATDERYLAGVGFMLLAALVWTAYAIAQKKLLLTFHTKDILVLLCVGGSVLLLPFSEPSQVFQLDRVQLGLLLFCGLNTVIAYGAFGLALSYWEASRVSAIVPLTPLLTLLFTWILGEWFDLDIASEPLDMLGVLGALMVVTGSAMAALPRGQK
ncbi:MAG: DMT family transporter [Halioglobus sp.]